MSSMDGVVVVVVAMLQAESSSWLFWVVGVEAVTEVEMLEESLDTS